MGKPIKLSASEEKRVLEYLDSETHQAENYVLHPLQQKREEWNDLYYGVTKPRLEDWMSNFPILLGATFTDAILARIINTTFAYKPTFTIEPTQDSKWSKIAKNVERYLEFKVRTEMDLYNAYRRTLFDTVRLGTGVMMTPWVEETATYPVRWAWIERQVPVRVKQSVVAQYLPIRDFLYPPGYSTLHYMPWWARRMYWTPQMLRVEDRRGYYDVPDEVLKHLEPLPMWTEQARQRTDESGYPQRILGWETWAKLDLKEDGDVKRYVFTWHPGLRKILRAELDTYPRWPLSIFRYGIRDQGMTGLGIIEMVAPYETALYALYNLLVDNFKGATMLCFKGKKGANLRSDTKIRPLKLFLLDNPETDLIPMQMGAPYALNPTFMNSVWDLGERRAGVSDYALGRESPIVAGRATATGTLALIQEGQRRFDLTIHDVRTTTDDIGQFTLAVMHQMLSGQAPYMVLGPDGQYVQEWLEMPAIPPQYVLKLMSSMSNIALNRETEKQSAQMTFQLLGSYYQQIVQLMMGMLNPQTPPEMRQVLSNIAVAAGNKLQKVLEAYGEISPAQYTDVLVPLLQAQQGGLGGGVPNQGNGGGVPQQPGMEMAAGGLNGTPESPSEEAAGVSPGSGLAS